MSSVLLDREKTPGYDFHWRCDKWSEEACDFARKQADKLGITHVISHMEVREGRSGLIEVPKLIPITEGVPSSVLRALVGEPEEVKEIHGNLLLNEGIQLLLNLSMVASGLVSNGTATNYWSNTNSYIGVGDSSTAEAATQTDLQAATNHFYKVMNATFPSRASQTVSFQSDFVSAEANFVWAEWSIAAGATGVSGSGFTTGTTNLNRKVSALGTKSTGTWTLTGQVTFS